MSKVAICFSASGAAVLEKLNEASTAAGLQPWECHISMEGDVPDGFVRIKDSLQDWCALQFSQQNAILFVGALGIAVRSIAPSVKDKLTDSPVLVIDDLGQFVIPVLSGHVGSANKLAVTVAKLLDAVPVLTTATDIHEAFSSDVFAKEQMLTIANRDGIKRVNAKAIEGKHITLSIKDFPPQGPVDIIVADTYDKEYELLLRPKRYTIGIGTKKDIPYETLERTILELLAECHIELSDLYALCTIDLKEDEPALQQFCNRYHLPLLTFDAALLKKAEGDFTASDFVNRTVGVDNVCERAAVLGAGCGKLIVPKQAGCGIT
ncbi:MAG: cobalamin biosynthesis protein, partial [Lachnospiraceae bacterium]|nr:cobalamin biosynthesis protein [Lachnospiraceae bacterium]